MRRAYYSIILHPFDLLSIRVGPAATVIIIIVRKWNGNKQVRQASRTCVISNVRKLIRDRGVPKKNVVTVRGALHRLWWSTVENKNDIIRSFVNANTCWSGTDTEVLSKGGGEGNIYKKNYRRIGIVLLLIGMQISRVQRSVHILSTGHGSCCLKCVEF